MHVDGDNMYKWIPAWQQRARETNFKQIFPFGFTPLYMFILLGDLSRRRKNTHT
jgi:hypothetical protein